MLFKMTGKNRLPRLRLALFFLLSLSLMPPGAADLMAQPGGSLSPNVVYLPLLLGDHAFPVSIFGVQMDYLVDDSNGLQQALAGGAHWLRFDAFEWDRIEPVSTVPATYHWGQVDEVSLGKAGRNGLDLIAVVKYTPGWAQKYPGSVCGPIDSEALGRFADFLFALVSRYKNPPFNIRHWELGNEPDAPNWQGRPAYGCWGDPSDPYFGGGYYARMLKAAYPAIKAADPQARVLLGGLLLDNPVEDPQTMARFLEGILREGGGPYFDLVSFHGYSYLLGAEGQMGNPSWPGSGTSVTPKVTFIRDILNRYGLAHKPLISTEAALYCGEATPECLETQAMFVTRAYAEGIAAGLEGLIYYALICEYRSIGLLRPDLSPRPSYRAYQAAASFLTKARYGGLPTGYPEGITGYSFIPALGGSLDLIWSRDGIAIQVPLLPGALAYDRYGVPLEPVAGMVSVGYGPIYIKKIP